MFGFLKEKLKQTIEKLTKEVDQATEKIKPTEEQKKEIVAEIKKEQEEKKGFFSKLKEVIIEKKQVTVEEKKIEVIEKKPSVSKKYKEEKAKEEKKELAKKIKEGERDIEEAVLKKKEKKKEEKIEEKGFFTRLKEKFTGEKEEEKEQETDKEEKKEKPLFETSEQEIKEFEEAFKEKEQQKEDKEEIIPVVTETEEGETVFEIQEKFGIREEERETGFFGALKDTIFKTSLSEEKFEELFWELEMVLLENNVAVEVINIMKQNLKKDLVEKKILRGHISEIILKSLQKSVEQTLSVPTIDFIERVKEKKPFVIVFVGVNGSGKTTTIAKMAQKLKENKLSCVIAAGDTFRAAAIQQLEEHANKLHIKMIKHDYGSDPAAVGFDAIKYAQAHNIDCVLIDTAGRLHSNTNLMDEMKKIIRVTKPDLKIFIGEAITGNDCVDQARKFHEAIGIDGIILAKADVDEKGGAALSISYVTKKPIIFIGTGQGYSDLQPFDKEKVIEQLGLA